MVKQKQEDHHSVCHNQVQDCRDNKVHNHLLVIQDNNHLLVIQNNNHLLVIQINNHLLVIRVNNLRLVIQIQLNHSLDSLDHRNYKVHNHLLVIQINQLVAAFHNPHKLPPKTLQIITLFHRHQEKQYLYNGSTDSHLLFLLKPIKHSLRNKHNKQHH